LDKNGILISLAESTRTEFGRVDFGDQSDAQRVFSAIWALESHVNNGGFLQYFEGSDGDTAEYAPVALRAIGALACAEIVERALRTALDAELPRSETERQELMGSLSDDALARLEEIDQQFFEYPDNLTELLFAYVAARPEVFGPIEGQPDTH
jgi:hypothetical protein